MGLKKLVKEYVQEGISSLEIEDPLTKMVANKIVKGPEYSYSDEILSKSKCKHYFKIKQQSYSLKEVVDLLKGNYISERDTYAYKIFDEKDKMQYMVDVRERLGTDLLLADRDALYLYDENEKKIGCVKENLVAVNVPFFKSKSHNCSVYMNNKKLCELHKYVEFGDLTIDVHDSNYHVKVNEMDKMTLKRGNKNVAKYHFIPMIPKNGYVDNCVVEYNDLEDGVIAVLFAIAINLIKGKTK